MLLAFHGATTMPQTLETDVAVTAAAGFRALEVWAAKVDRYLADHSLKDLQALFAAAGVLPLTINSIEFIAFRPADEYAAIRARCQELSRIAQAIGCSTVVVVPSPLPDRSLAWADIVAEYVRVLRDLGEYRYLIYGLVIIAIVRLKPCDAKGHSRKHSLHKIQCL